MINKIGQSRSRGLICLITSMITDQIGRCEVLVPIIITATKFVIFYAFFKIQTRNFESFFFASSEKKPFKHVRGMARTVQAKSLKTIPCSMALTHLR